MTRVIRLRATEQRLPESVRLAFLSGFVLAGGASRRMGSPKTALSIDGQPMLKRQVLMLRSVARSVGVVGGSSGYLTDLEVFGSPDAMPCRGPLAGIYTALLETRTEFNLVLGCDLPFVTRRLLAFLADRAVSIRGDVTVPISRDGRLQPLCAVYRRRALYAVRTSLAEGENRPRMCFRKIHCTIVPWNDLAQAGFGASVFSNMNTPDDYDYARKRLEATVASFA